MKSNYFKTLSLPFYFSMTLLLQLSLSSLIFAQDGTLVTSFGNGGKFAGVFGPGLGLTYGTKTFIAVQQDGKIILVGAANLAVSQFGVLRLNANGTVDSTFGTKGYKTFAIPNSSTNYPYAVALQSDEKILVAGYTIPSGGKSKFALVRFTSSGKVDSTFGTSGYDTLSFGAGPDEAYSATVQPDGKIVLVGLTKQGSADFAMARFLSTGAIDASFGTNGKVITDVAGNWDRAQTVKLQSDGKIIVCGRANEDVGADFAIARYTSSGKLDSTFGVKGGVVTNVTASDLLYGLAILKDGKIIAAGRVQDSLSRIAVVKYLANGTLDASFGSAGIVTHLPLAGSNNFVYDLLVQDDGKIIVAGYNTPSGKGDDYLVTRFNANGTIDNTFGTSGSVLLDLSGTSAPDEAYSIAKSNDGNLLVVGMTMLTVGNGFGVAKLKSSGLTFVEQRKILPSEFSLNQNYPNPFNPSTNISYQIPVNSTVSLKVFDLLGREIATVVNEPQQAGSYSYQFSTEKFHLSSGIYFYQLHAGNFIETKRMLMLK